MSQFTPKSKLLNKKLQYEKFIESLYEQRKVEILGAINTYIEEHDGPPILSTISEKVRINENVLIHLIPKLYGDGLVRLTAENLTLPKVVKKDYIYHFQVDITTKGIEVLRRADK